MDAQSHEVPKDNDSVGDLIQRIKLGSLDPTTLAKDQRQLCVEALYFESGSTSGIATFLKVADRTIRRDLEDIRSRNALDPDPELARKLIGDFVHGVAVHRANLMKLARNSSASIAERAQAEYYACLALIASVTKMQSLGYLPKSPDSLLLMQRRDEDQCDDRVAAALAELEAMAGLTGDPQKAERLLALKKSIAEENSNGNPEEKA